MDIEMSKKGLGKGLGALFGDDAIDSVARDFEYIPLQRIEPMQDQPRSLFEEEKINELADSIRDRGVLTPLIVRSLEGGYYQIIAGERRWRAAREAGVSEIPVRTIIASDKEALEIALIENLQREDLTPIEEARGYRLLMERNNMTQEDVAKAVRKSRPAVANSLRLLSLPTELMVLVESNELSAGSARALLALKSEERMLEAAKMIVSNDMSVREVEALVRKLNKEKAERTKQMVSEVNYLLEAQNALTAAMGRRVIIKQSKGKGKIEMEYYDQEDFNVLYDALLANDMSEVSVND